MDLQNKMKNWNSLKKKNETDALTQRNMDQSLVTLASLSKVMELISKRNVYVNQI